MYKFYYVEHRSVNECCNNLCIILRNSIEKELTYYFLSISFSCLVYQIRGLLDSFTNTSTYKSLDFVIFNFFVFGGIGHYAAVIHIIM